MPGVYDYPCPQCGGKIVSTARMMDCTRAPTKCEAGHTFMRAEATAATNTYALNMMNQVGQHATRKEALAEFYKGLRKDLGQEEQADMKPSFGQMPLRLEASMRLKAFEVEAATRLMARATQVSKVAEQGTRDIVQEFIRLGYIADTQISKAFYTTTFTNEDTEDKPEHVFQMVGWHGTGRYGTEKTILEFYDEDKSKTKPVVTIGVINDENINPAKQLEVVDHILDYVKHHG